MLGRVTFFKDDPSHSDVQQSLNEQERNVSRDLKPYKIKNDIESLNKILSMIDETLNQFDVNVDKSHLFNIATGK